MVCLAPTSQTLILVPMEIILLLSHNICVGVSWNETCHAFQRRIKGRVKGQIIVLYICNRKSVMQDQEYTLSSFAYLHR